MFPLAENLKELVAAGTVIITLAAGYTGLQKDVAAVRDAQQVEATKNGEQDGRLQQQEVVAARVDERTRIMKEQLDRIEKEVTGGRK